jgi:hypothetical protein
MLGDSTPEKRVGALSQTEKEDRRQWLTDPLEPRSDPSGRSSPFLAFPENVNPSQVLVLKKEVPIDDFPLPDEPSSDYRRRLEEWRQPGRPVTPVEQSLIAQALYALDEAERCKRLLAVQRIEKARTAVIRYREACEDEVTYYIAMFNRDPNAAVAGLRRSAAGVRHLISRWEELGLYLAEEGTWYGTHRYEAIQMQGCYAGIDQLFLSEEAWKTWIDCLASQPVIKQFDIDMLCAPDIVPKSIQDRDQPLWQPDPAASRARLRALVDRELPALRALEAELRTVYEEPALAAAEDMALARLTREETVLLRALRSHEAAFRQAAGVLEKLQRPAASATPAPEAALVTPPPCADPPGPGARRPRRRVPITPPFARPVGPGSPTHRPESPAHRTEAAAAQVHGGPACRNGHRQAAAQCRPSRGERGVCFPVKGRAFAERRPTLGPSRSAAKGLRHAAHAFAERTPTTGRRPVHGNEADATQVRGGPVCRDGHREAAAQCRPSLRDGSSFRAARRALAERRPTMGRPSVHWNEADASQLHGGPGRPGGWG